MSNLICPFCNGELVGTIGHPICRNQDCVMYDDPMPQDLLEELIRTRKALDVALDEIDKIKVAAESVGIGFFMTAAISASVKIKTALEQKDVK